MKKTGKKRRGKKIDEVILDGVHLRVHEWASLLVQRDPHGGGTCYLDLTY